VIILLQSPECWDYSCIPPCPDQSAIFLRSETIVLISVTTAPNKALDRSGDNSLAQWLSPVILATQEAEIRRIMVGSQTRQIVL
jgi:hypothetical protein